MLYDWETRAISWAIRRLGHDPSKFERRRKAAKSGPARAEFERRLRERYGNQLAPLYEGPTFVRWLLHCLPLEVVYIRYVYRQSANRPRTLPSTTVAPDWDAARKLRDARPRPVWHPLADIRNRQLQQLLKEYEERRQR